MSRLALPSPKILISGDAAERPTPNHGHCQRTNTVAGGTEMTRNAKNIISGILITSAVAAISLATAACGAEKTASAKESFQKAGSSDPVHSFAVPSEGTRLPTGPGGMYDGQWWRKDVHLDEPFDSVEKVEARHAFSNEGTRLPTGPGGMYDGQWWRKDVHLDEPFDSPEGREARRVPVGAVGVPAGTARSGW